MFIQTEDTPNPATMKFIPGREVLAANQKPVDFADASQAAKSPLAQALLAVDGVKSVFLGHGFVTVTKKDGVEWTDLRTSLLDAVAGHYESGRPALIGDAAENKSPEEKDGETIRKICELLDKKIRPAVAQDGGDIVFHSFEDGVVYLTLRGACAGCPSATATLKSGVENMLRYYVPEVKEVRQKKQ